MNKSAKRIDVMILSAGCSAVDVFVDALQFCFLKERLDGVSISKDSIFLGNALSIHLFLLF